MRAYCFIPRGVEGKRNRPTLAQRICCLLLWVTLTSALIHSQTMRKPNLVLHGVLTRADHETYRMLPFKVPVGTNCITVEFSFTGQEQHTTLDLGLFGPERFRGWSGGNKSCFTLSASDATPSYLSGPITSGVWKIAIGVPNIRPDVRSEYTANIFVDFDGHSGDPALQWERRRGGGDIRASGNLRPRTLQGPGSGPS